MAKDYFSKSTTVDLPPDYTHMTNINNDVPALFTSAPESFEHGQQMIEQYQSLNDTMEDLGAGIGEAGRINQETREIEEQINASRGSEFADNCDPPEQGEDLNKGE